MKRKTSILTMFGVLLTANPSLGFNVEQCLYLDRVERSLDSKISQFSDVEGKLISNCIPGNSKASALTVLGWLSGSTNGESVETCFFCSARLKKIQKIVPQNLI